MLPLILKLRSFFIKIFTETNKKWFLIQYTEKVTHSVKFLTHTHTEFKIYFKNISLGHTYRRLALAFD